MFSQRPSEPRVFVSKRIVKASLLKVMDCPQLPRPSSFVRLVKRGPCRSYVEHRGYFPYHTPLPESVVRSITPYPATMPTNMTFKAESVSQNTTENDFRLVSQT